MAFDPNKFKAKSAKPLPVVLLLDVSGSMGGQKIDSLNRSVEDMITSFKGFRNNEIEISLAIITFGQEISLHQAYSSAENIEYIPMEANGSTPMGGALSMAKAMIEDKETTPLRAYKPCVILVSDGGPNDEWKDPMEKFISEGRSKKCDRFAIAIGEEAELLPLEMFVAGTENPKVHKAHEASDIQNLFKLATMSIQARTQSVNPDDVPDIDDLPTDDEVLFDNP